MTVSVILKFPTVEAATHALARLDQPLPLQQGQSVPTEQKTGPMLSATDARAQTVEAALAEPTAPAPVEQTSKRRGRPKASPVTPEMATAVITKEEAFAKFKAVHDSKGLPVCMTVLQRLGAKRFADVSANLYPDLLKLCDKAIAGEDLTAASE